MTVGRVASATLGGVHPERLRRMVLMAATPGEPQGRPLPASTATLLRGQVSHGARTGEEAPHHSFGVNLIGQFYELDPYRGTECPNSSTDWGRRASG